jgi:hypothetical protein
MKGITILVCFFGLFTQLPQLKLQSQSETFAKKTEAGFADAVSDTLERMQGKWTIKSASLLGADLPLDQFELLTVDKDGFTLDVQKRKTQFAFAEFKLESKTLIAKCVSPGYKDGLAYEISFSDELVKIRYRTNGAHIPPVPTDDDKQLLVQSWKKSQTE